MSRKAYEMMIENVIDTIREISPAVTHEFVGKRLVSKLHVTRSHTGNFDVSQIFSDYTFFAALCLRKIHCKKLRKRTSTRHVVPDAKI